MSDTPVIAAVRPLAPGGHFTQTEVDHLNAVSSSFAARAPAARAPAARAPAAPVATVVPFAVPAAAVDQSNPLTVMAALELVSHEAIVREWYLDSSGIGTWGIGVTDASGHTVGRYKDNPQTIQHCLEVYIWLLRRNYIPDVLAAFAGHALTEAQFAAALSFHYNTGRVQTTDWVTLWRQGNVAAARAFLESHYLNDGVLTARRKAEAALFFDGRWSNNGRVSVFPVAKPSYHPDFRHGERVDITADLTAAMATA